MPPLFPERASTMAYRVDALYFFLLAVGIFFSLLIAGLIVIFAVRYRRRTADAVGERIHGNLTASNSTVLRWASLQRTIRRPRRQQAAW